VDHPSDPGERATVPDDARLIAWLADALRAADPPPDDMVELAKLSFALRTLDAELAALVEDSADPATQPVPVRESRPAAPGGPDLRQLTFHFHDDRTGDDLIIAVEVDVRGDRRRLTGQLTPPMPARIEVRQPAVPRARRIDVDQFGRFTVDELVAGPASLTCHRTGVPAVVTEWTLL
jgi:hypothetical protein